MHMRIEENQSGYMRCWLNEEEQQKIINYYEEQPKKQLAIRLMLQGGLRSEEVPRVSKSDLEPSEEADFTRLQVRQAKAGRRATVVPSQLSQQIRTVSNITKQDEIINVTPRTVQNWVTAAAEDIATQTTEEDWKRLSAHDLRRTWATTLINQGIPSSLVMEWGGWADYKTFKQHYWMESDEAIQEHLNRIGMY